jgi:hypothetical protein
MKRREIIKRLSTIPLAGSFLSMEPIFANSFNENAFDPNHQSVGSKTLTPEGPLTPGPSKRQWLVNS